MKTITLTIQSTANNWRLGLYKEDSIKYFTHLESVEFVLTEGLILFCNAACGTSKKKAYDFNNVDLSKWIVDNNFHHYPHRKPTKLIFSLTILKNKKTLTFQTIQTSP